MTQARALATPRPSDRPGEVLLHHFTTPTGLDGIRARGCITTTLGGVNPEKPFAGPNVVWMTTAPTATGAVDGRKAQAGLYRLTLSLPADEVVDWGTFTERWERTPAEIDFMLAALPIFRSWWLISRPVRFDECVMIRDMSTGRDFLPCEPPDIVATRRTNATGGVA